jgi:phosphate transport system substrate-binding protein
MRLPRLASLLFCCCLLPLPCLRAQQAIEPGQPYAPDQPIRGEIELVGSTLMQQLASLWLKEFQKVHPDVQGSIDCTGSEASFPQLRSDKPIVGMFSRSISEDELAAASKEAGRQLQAITVGHDVLAVIIHPANPIDALRWDRARASLWNRVGEKSVERWGDLGVEPPLGEEGVRFHVPGKSHALRSLANRFLISDLSVKESAIRELDDPADITESVSQNPSAIALVSTTRARDKRVKALPLQVNNRLLSPFDANGPAKGYPLVRNLSFVFSVDAAGVRHPVIEEFVNFALSQKGQRILSQDGFIPLESAALDSEREKLGWEVIK